MPVETSDCGLSDVLANLEMLCQPRPTGQPGQGEAL